MTVTKDLRLVDHDVVVTRGLPAVNAALAASHFPPLMMPVIRLSKAVAQMKRSASDTIIPIRWPRLRLLWMRSM